MFCKKCGSTLRDNAKFCDSCGAVVEVADNKGNNFSYTAPVDQTPYTAPVQNGAPYTAPVQNDGGKTVPVKMNKPSFTKSAPKVSMDGITSKMPKNLPGKGKLLPIIAVAAVVVLVLVLVFGGVFGGPAGKVTKALTKSVAAFTGIADEMKLPDLVAIAEGGKFNQEMKAEFTDGDLEGLGIRATVAYNQSGKEFAVVAAPYFEGTDLITGQIKLEGSKIYVGCPELMDKTYIMLDTKTIGEDLANMDMDGAEDLSFDIFELIDKITEASALTKDQEKALEKAQAALLKAIEVEKDGKKDIKVNGKKISCQLYTVVIPQDAMEDYLDVMEDVIKDMDAEATLDILEEAGFPVDDMGISVDNDAFLDVIDDLADVIDELGDLELTVGINGGYVVHVAYEGDLYDTEYEITLQIGGGDEYVNDISLEILEDGGDYGTIITSTGNHAMKKGEFTDETTVVEIWGGDEEDVLVSELTWKPSGKSDNFEWVLESYGDEIEIEGTLLCSKDSLTITLPALELDGEELSFTYSLGGYKAPSIKTSNTMKFSDMDESDLEELGEMIMENGEEWAEMIEDDYPEFVEMIDMLSWYLY